MNHFDFGLLVIRVTYGVFLAYHGYNKFFNGGKLPGTARWFGSIGMKWPELQARLAASTEVGAGLLFAVGLLTPFAAAGMIGVMVVAIVTTHWKVGFFINRPGQGWEYCASIAITAFGVAAIGPGRASLDHAIGLDWNSWWGAVIAGVVGIGGAVAQLVLSYRPQPQAAT